jgi:hypothetical protein
MSRVITFCWTTFCLHRRRLTGDRHGLLERPHPQVRIDGRRKRRRQRDTSRFTLLKPVMKVMVIAGTNP